MHLQTQCVKEQIGTTFNSGLYSTKFKINLKTVKRGPLIRPHPSRHIYAINNTKKILITLVLQILQLCFLGIVFTSIGLNFLKASQEPENSKGLKEVALKRALSVKNLENVKHIRISCV
jgi:hypothetical protein